MRILNLYAGIGGNRALWGDEHEVTAVELDSDIAALYMQLWPQDRVLVLDAHQYLLDHHKEFDFIWSSPPCPTHSRLQIPQNAKGNVRYPDMSLYQEIIFLEHFCHVPYVVENVIGYYRPLIAPTRELARHYFWTNFHLAKYYNDSGTYKIIRSAIGSLEGYLGIELPRGTVNARKLLRNCVHPKLGLHVFNCRDNLKQEVLL